MDNLEDFRSRRDLRGRRVVSLSLPEFLVQALEYRVAETNDGATEEERVSLDHVVEVELAGTLSLADVARLEAEMPGISGAVAEWLSDID